MALYAVAGDKIYIGGVIAQPSADLTATDFSSQTWVEIANWTTMGAYGDTAASITVDLIGRQRTAKLKGTYDAGTMENTFASDPLDAGQIALIAARASNNNYAFKVELNDKPATGASPKNSLRYFAGLVMSSAEQGGAANTVQTITASIGINSNIVSVAASAT